MDTNVEQQAEVVPVVKSEDSEVEEITVNGKNVDCGGETNVESKENGNSPAKESNTNGETAMPERRMSLRARTTPKKYLEDQNSDDDITEELYVRERDPLAVEIIRVSKSPNKINSKSPRSSRPPPDLVKTTTGTKSQVSILPTIPSSTMPRPKDTSGFVIVDTQSILTGKGPIALSSVPASITVSSVSSARVTSVRSTDAAERTSKASPKPKSVDPFEQLGLADDSFIVEAPSFVVPYLIEKPAEGNLKKAVDSINKTREDVIVLDGDETAEGREKMEEAGGTKIEDQSSMKTEMQEYASEDYFSGAIGKFFLDIGLSMVQEYVQEDLLRVQKRKIQRGAQVRDPSLTVDALQKGLEQTRAKNSFLKLKIHQCDRCNFRTDSALVLTQHWVTPYQRGSAYHCHFCEFESREPQGAAQMVALHIEQDHGVRARLEAELNGHQCPFCPFEDSIRSKVTRHVLSCQKKFLPARNLEPPRDWEPPAKIPRIAPKLYNSMSSPYSLPTKSQMNYPLPSYHPLLPKSAILPNAALPGYAMLPNGQLTYVPRVLQNSKTERMLAPAVPGFKLPAELQLIQNSRTSTPPGKSSSGYRNSAANAGQLYPYAVAGNQVYQQLLKGQNAAMSVIPSGSSPKPPPAAAATTRKSSSNSSVVVLPGRSSTTTNPSAGTKAKTSQQPSISITPLPRPGGGGGGTTTASTTKSIMSVGPVPGSVSAGKDNVVCEICDSVIKDLEQLRHHMQWIHKVKIHPKMIHNRPPLNCQKCQCRFFTDQGLERHLLGSHGLVTSSMQEAANKGQDGGRCPICGRVHQWKLLSHVVKDHGLTLKPAHLSYKCTVCTATFGMYKLFESHVYTAHSVVAKKVLDKNPSKPGGDTSSSSSVRINDEITIIAQPARGNSGTECQNCHGSSDRCENCTRKRKVDVIDLIDDDETDGGADKDASSSKSQVTITKVAGPARNSVKPEPPAKRVRQDEMKSE